MPLNTYKYNTIGVIFSFFIIIFVIKYGAKLQQKKYYAGKMNKKHHFNLIYIHSKLRTNGNRYKN